MAQTVNPGQFQQPERAPDPPPVVELNPAPAEPTEPEPEPEPAKPAKHRKTVAKGGKSK